MKISICIPTYNRSVHLANCLQSIILNKEISNIDFEVCVSDNCSVDETEQVVKHAQEKIPIKYKKNNTNLGIPRNFLNVVEMAVGEFVWLIGDDDLLMPNALESLNKLIHENQNVDFFYINSFHLTTEYVLSFPKPFDTAHLPNNMKPVSSWPKNGEMMFMDLINPKISFDFLGGMFLSVFKRQNWVENVDALDQMAISDCRTFSHFDNTFPHVKIFTRAFSTSKAFFSSMPLSVCLSGAREWAPMSPLIRSVRLVEALEEYRKNGLSYFKYFQCKNYAFRNFIPDMVLMCLNRKSSGYAFVNPFFLIFKNCMYPNFYFSFFLFFIRKAKKITSKPFFKK